MNWTELLAAFGSLWEMPRRVQAMLITPLVDIPIYRMAGWSGWERERLLAYYGVRTYSRGFDPILGEYHQDDPHCLHLYVSIKQARWAEHLLLAARAPLAIIRWHTYYPPFMPVPWHAPLKPAGMTGWLLTVLDALTGDTVTRHLESLLQAGERTPRCSHRKLYPRPHKRPKRRRPTDGPTFYW